ncbi:cytochrome P450 family protein [Tieghemostelium lacteum]|uniref:Cytochrome P450 family protein n=1 Tax=Tieghemostelium lacteum TaxID=361077 RepID=A0A151Z765_TIELA|nr:cytochrome P450 family protein [Tieghemostelium lacteum]|eukprot:KYQ89803.1 cytochrome P450 family protein [Tieghemostelium lacteum]
MFLILIIIIIIYLFFDTFRKNRFNSTLKQPFALPFLGNLHLLGISPHETIRKFTKIYGNVYGLWFGDHYSVIVSDIHVAREIFVQNFENFSDRPHIPSIASASNDFKDLALGNEDYWKLAKRKVANTFLKSKLMNHAYDLIHEESLKFVKSFENYAKDGKIVQPRRLCQRYVSNIILGYAFNTHVSYEVKNKKEMVGNERDLNELLDSVEEFLKLIASGNILDYLHIAYPFYYKYLQKYGPHNKIQTLIRDLYQEHKRTLDSNNPRDLIDNLILETMQSQEKGSPISMETETLQNILIGFDFFVAGSDTSSNILEWLILMLCNYPEVQEQVYKELTRLHTSEVLINHKRSTPYLCSVIKEVMRYHSVAPLGLPRVAKDDITLSSGIHIPAKSQILLNIGGIGLDERYFQKADKFKPDRFMHEAPSNYHIAFGLGSRQCAGSQLAQDEIYAAASNLLLNYKFSYSNPNEKISEKEEYGTTIHPLEHFSVLLENR